MSEKTNTLKKSASKNMPTSRIVASRKKLTPLQTVTIGLLMVFILYISFSSMVTYSSVKEPSENIFNNSQTIQVLNQ